MAGSDAFLDPQAARELEAARAQHSSRVARIPLDNSELIERACAQYEQRIEAILTDAAGRRTAADGANGAGDADADADANGVGDGQSPCGDGKDGSPPPT